MNTRKPLRLIAVIVLLFQLAALNAPAQAAPTNTFNVNTFAETDDANPGNGACADSSGDCSLRAAVMEADRLAGTDTINLQAGTYHLTQFLDVRYPTMIINGVSRATTLIDGTGAGGTRAFIVSSIGALELNDLTLTNFDSAIFMNDVPAAQVTVRRSNLRSNQSLSASGAITNYCESCTIYLIASYVYSNQAENCGAIFNGGMMYIQESSHVHNNTATDGFGGAICNSGTLYISNSLLYTNDAEGASSKGGAISQSGSGALLSIYNSEIFENTAYDGGGVNVAYGDLFITASQIYENTADNEGGGLKLNLDPGSATIDQTNIHTNEAAYGGGIFVDSDLELTDSSVISNTATVDGGGLAATDGLIEIENVTFSGNHADRDGAGVHASSVGVEVDLEYATVTRNTADYDDNGDGRGGGLYRGADAVMRIFASIIADNEDLTATPEELYAPDCLGTITSDGFNLVGLRTGLCTISGVTTGNQVGAVVPGIDPKLDVLTSAGVVYYHPLFYGPAVDRGHPSLCPTTDQIGSWRPYGTASRFYTPRCDVGAIESGYKTFGIYLPALKK